MPSRTKLKNAAIAARSAALPKIPDELIDQFVTGPMTGETVNAASLAFKKALIERAMGAATAWATRLAQPDPLQRPTSATARQEVIGVRF